MESLNMHIDRRSAKTKKAIIKALAALMSEKEISKITIKEIADLADINRKTFYAHYSSVYEILDELENNIIDSLTDIIGTVDFARGAYNPYTIYERITALAYENFDIYEHLMKSTAHSNLMVKIKSVVKDRIVEAYAGAEGLDKAMLSYTVEYIAGGTIAVYEYWFNSDRSKTLEEISRLIGDLTFESMRRLLGANSQ